MAFNLFTRSEPADTAAKGDAPFDLKVALKNADKTRPPDKKNVERLPVNITAAAAARANAAAVFAEAELQKAQIKLDHMIAEGKTIIQELHDKVQIALQDLENKQFALARELVEIGAFERIPNMQKFLQDAKDRADGLTQPDDYSPTVRIEE